MASARTRALLTPLVLLLVAGAAVAYAILGVGRRDEIAAAKAEASARILDFRPEDVQAFEIEAGGAPRVRVERAGAAWKITAPAAAPADRGVVEGLLRAASGLRRRSTVAPEADDAARARYGLVKPQGLLTFSLTGGRTVTLRLGDENGFDGTLYAVGPSGSVDVVDGQVRWTLLRTADELRFKPPPPPPKEAPSDATAPSKVDRRPATP